MRIIKASSAGSAHELAVKTVLRYGYPQTTEDGKETIECAEFYITYQINKDEEGEEKDMDHEELKPVVCDEELPRPDRRCQHEIDFRGMGENPPSEPLQECKR